MHLSNEGGELAFQEGAKGSKDLPESVLEVPSLHEVELNHGKQDLPDFSRQGSAAGEPIMKERALLQACALPLRSLPNCDSLWRGAASASPQRVSWDFNSVGLCLRTRNKGDGSAP